MAKDRHDDPQRHGGGDRDRDGGDAGPGRVQPGPPVNQKALDGAANRGKRAPQSGSGVVVGSGAGAGGAGGAEDFDSDPVGGGGSIKRETPD